MLGVFLGPGRFDFAVLLGGGRRPSSNGARPALSFLYLPLFPFVSLATSQYYMRNALFYLKMAVSPETFAKNGLPKAFFGECMGQNGHVQVTKGVSPETFAKKGLQKPLFGERYRRNAIFCHFAAPRDFFSQAGRLGKNIKKKPFLRKWPFFFFLPEPAGL